MSLNEESKPGTGWEDTFRDLGWEGDSLKALHPLEQTIEENRSHKLLRLLHDFVQGCLAWRDQKPNIFQSQIPCSPRREVMWSMDSWALIIHHCLPPVSLPSLQALSKFQRDSVADTERCKLQKERKNFHLNCKMVSWAVNGCVSSLAQDAQEGPCNVKEMVICRVEGEST